MLNKRVRDDLEVVSVPTGSGKRSKRRSRSGSGFTLIEVLVAMTILAIGVLGVSAMQISSVYGQVVARNMDSCVNIVSGVLDRMRANKANIEDYGTNFVVGAGGSAPSGAIALEDYTALTDDMANYGMSASTLRVAIENGFPVPGVATAAASLTWVGKAGAQQCYATDIIRVDQ